MLRWFHALLPREERFFDLFARHSDAVVAGAEALRAMLEGGDAVAAPLPDRDGPRARRRRHHPRGADRGAPHLHHAVRSRRHQGPDHVDGRRHRPDAEDRQGDHAVRVSAVRAADARDGTTADRELRRPGAGGDAAAELDQRPMPAAERDHRARFRSSRAAPTISTTSGCRSSILQAPRANTMAFIVGTEIYDHLEKVVDRFDDVANEINGIVIEHV